MALHDDIGDRQVRKRAEDYAKQDATMRADAVRLLLKHPFGRRYLYWLLDIGKAIGQNPYTGNAEGTIFNCGEQNVGQQIMAHLLAVSPEGFLGMMQERAEERMELNATQENFDG